MTVLNFTLSAENVSRTREILVCLSRFSETVSIEATPNTLTLSSLNIAKTSFAAFKLHASDYFESYELSQDLYEKFSCSVFNKALFSIFKTRLSDTRDNDTSIERCEISVFEGTDRVACRIVARLICRHGVRKTFKLTYEPLETLFPAFDETSARNAWTISASILRSLSEHFGTRAEHLDFFQDAGRMLLTSYTEKIARGNEILKQPLQTTIAIDRLDFDSISVEEHQHVGISVKDFRAIIAHADLLKASVTAKYSKAAQPLRFVYSDSGLDCEFTLVTMSAYLGTTIKTTSDAPTSRPAVPPPVQASLARTSQQLEGHVFASGTMPAPPIPSAQGLSRIPPSTRQSRPSPPPPQASINQESLFLADDDDDSRWGERNYEDDNDAVRWDTGEDLLSRPSLGHSRGDGRGNAALDEEDGQAPVPPTQRLSQIRGLFDD